MSDPAAGKARFPVQELLPRILSAAVLAAATLALTWIGGWPFGLLIAAVAGIIAWEWGRLMRGADLDLATVLSCAGLLVTIMLAVSGRPVPAVAVLLLTAAGVWLAAAEDEGRLGAGGVLYAGLPSLALVWVREAPEHGLAAIVLLLLVVWATDTGAFVAGRAVGGPRLMPRVSPNKTWSGLIGGMVSAAVVGWLVARGAGSPAPGRVLVLSGVLAIVSQAGDLAESAMKRSHGVKDTSQLIPGHGGFMDRVDGLVFAAVAAAGWALAVDAGSPASALLGFR